MPEFLVCIMYHEPEYFELWNRGIIEDYESIIGLFIEANSAEDATAWGEEVGKALLWHFNRNESLDWKGLGYYCWIDDSSYYWPPQGIDDPQRVHVGEMPNFGLISSTVPQKLKECLKSGPPLKRRKTSGWFEGMIRHARRWFRKIVTRM